MCFLTLFINFLRSDFVNVITEIDFEGNGSNFLDKKMQAEQRFKIEEKGQIIVSRDKGSGLRNVSLPLIAVFNVR